MSAPVSAELVEAAAAGDEAAAACIDAAFRSRIEHACRRSGLAAEDARALAQEVLLAVFRQLRAGSFRQQAAFGTWVHAIAHNMIVEHWRRRGRLTRFLDRYTVNPQATSSPDLVILVAQALEALPAREALILVLRYQEGRTLEEIGALVGLKKSRVDEILHEAKRKFANAVQGAGKGVRHPRLKDGEDE